MRRKQGRLKPGGQYLNPTTADTNSADDDANTGDKDANTGDKDSNITNKDVEERDKNVTNKDASTLVKAPSTENVSSVEDKPQVKGKTRNMKKTDPAVDKQDFVRKCTERDRSKIEETGMHPGIHVLPSEDPEALPQVCLGAFHYTVHA